MCDSIYPMPCPCRPVPQAPSSLRSALAVVVAPPSRAVCLGLEFTFETSIEQPFWLVTTYVADGFIFCELEAPKWLRPHACGACKLCISHNCMMDLIHAYNINRHWMIHSSIAHASEASYTLQHSNLKSIHFFSPTLESGT